MQSGQTLAQCQSQPQSLGRPVRGDIVKIAVKEHGQLILRDSAAGILHRDQHPLGQQPQLHGDGAAPVREFQGVGEELGEDLFQDIRIYGADMALQLADKFELESQQLRKTRCPLTLFADQIHQIPVLEMQGAVSIHAGGQRQVVDQPQQAVIALIQQCGLTVQIWILFSGLRRSQLRRRQTEAAQGSSGLGGDIGQQGCQILRSSVHETPLLRARRTQDLTNFPVDKERPACRPAGMTEKHVAQCALGVAFAEDFGSTPGKAFLTQQQHTKKWGP